MKIRYFRKLKNKAPNKLAVLINKSVKSYYAKESGKVKFFPHEMEILSKEIEESIQTLFFDE